MGDKIVIYSKEWGVYLGTSMGMGFWSKLDPVGQDSACCFTTEDEAKAHVATWDEQPPQDTKFVTVTTVGTHWATIPECARAGIDIWNPMDDADVTTATQH